jgi:UDP-glucose:glycoprotein glucosyltransferase
MKYGKILCSIFVIIIKISLSYTAKSHPISTLVNAKFSITPVQLEVSEFLSDTSNQKFWLFLDELTKVDLDGLETDLERYNTTIGIAKTLLSHAQTKLLKFSISLRSLTIRIQSHFMIADDILKRGECRDSKAFVMCANELICSVDELKKKLKSVKSNNLENSDLYSFDHIYPGTENNAVVNVLYGEIGSKEFNEFHKVLKTEVQKGLIKYVTRHYIKERSSIKVRLSGYGVELHLKSTEYKAQDDSPTNERDKKGENDADTEETEVDGFDFNTLKNIYPHLSHSIDKMKASLLEKSEDIVPLKAWEFQELGLQAAHRVASIQGEESLSILQFIAQNFPSQAKSLLNIRVSEEFKAEMKNNIDAFARNLNLQPPDAALFINGLYFDAETLDAETLLDTLKKESSVLDGLKKIALQNRAYAPLLALDLSLQSKEFAIDIRDSSVIWINDLETDKEYKRWGSSVMDMLRPTFPGMMRSVRKNFFNLMLVFDPVKPDARDILRMSESFIANMAPIRFGVAFDTRLGTGKLNNLYRTLNCAFNYMHQKQGARDALTFLIDVYSSTLKDKDVEIETVQKVFKKTNPKLSKDEVEDALGEDSDFDYGRQLSEEFIERLGVKQLPQALLNGALLNEKLLNRDEYEELILTEIMQQTVKLQKKIYVGELADDENVIDYLMQQPHVMLRLNQRILSSDSQDFLDMYSGDAYPDIEDVTTLQTLNNEDLTATLMKNLRYFETKNSQEKFMKNRLHFLTLWVVTDLNNERGKNILRNGLEFLKSSSGVRLSFIPNADKPSAISNSKDLNAIMWSILNTLDGKEAIEAALQLLNGKYEPTSNVKGFLKAAELHLKMLRVYCQRVLKFKSDDTSIIANGKIYGPFDEGELFTSDDFNLLDKINQRNYIDKIKVALKSIKNDDEPIEINSEVMLQLLSLLMPRQSSKNRFNIPSELREDHTVIKLPAKLEDEPSFNIIGVLDPASRGAQKLAPLLLLLRQIINCDLKVYLNAVDKHSDMPVKNFYRYVVEPELRFSSDGKLMNSNYAKFAGLPVNSLLTQNLAVPENWIVDLMRSVYDLDNIRLSDIGGPVHSEYELEYLLLEGHCFDSTTGSPPRGLQFILGTKEQESVVDTIVMANLGYFQLKANPGAWILKLRYGKSSEIYDITNVDGLNTIHRVSDGYVSVVINSFRSHVLKVRVTKKPEQLSADLLGDDEPQSGIWDSITSTFSGGSSTDSSPETINIFSVASGHLYERLLRIMMLSLLKHTETPVKFWFLKNYLSPQFKDFLPEMSREYNFQYELVQYKWPRWLHQQTEKQRTIWGYKILFLDVLFPLDIKKIIFVDADQIVRADIKELYNMDLNGAPYAYTPFCSDRTEMDGFRFWNSGYWRNHLQGRKYHISALYVVDLKKFRKIAAGDRLRGQYQALSQDANSLANLDQDLPNNMIHQVPIKSLPQEWLWCETWCSDESLKHAKTIDLCNNPMTKEAKLSAAQRIVPEWKDYDAEIKNLMARIDDEQHQEQSASKQKKGMDLNTSHYL